MQTCTRHLTHVFQVVKNLESDERFITNRQVLVYACQISQHKLFEDQTVTSIP